MNPITRKELKLRARRSLCGNRGSLAGIGVVMMAASVLLLPAIYVVMLLVLMVSSPAGDIGSMVALLGCVFVIVAFYFVYALVTALFGAGLNKIYLEISQSRPLVFGDIFFAFKNCVFKFVGLVALLFGVGLVIAAPLTVYKIFFKAAFHLPLFAVALQLLQCAASCFVSLSFALSCYILIESPEKGVLQCMRESYDLMRGNRLRLLVLQISFIGWQILVLLSMGIGALWAVPYMMCTTAHFYLDLRERKRLKELEKAEAGAMAETETEAPRYEQ